MSDEQKLFVVTCTEGGYGWSQVKWTKYFISHSEDTLRSVLRNRYGDLDKYYRYGDEEEHIVIQEVEVEIL